MGVFIAVWLLCAFIGLAIGSTKGRELEGLLLGLALGVIGLVIIAVLSPTPVAQARRNREVAIATQTLDGVPPLRLCPWCAERIQPAAKVCRYCGREVEPTAPALSEAPDRPGWYPDPESLTNTKRYWDGNRWMRLD